MNPKLSDKAVDTIEVICGLGCSRVNQLIADSESGMDISELSDFDHTETRLIISELKQIMSVYDDDGNVK